MPVCCVESCKTSYHTHPKVSLHRFPADDNLRNLWKSQLGVQSLEITPRTFVCSRHFTLNDYNKKYRHRKQKYTLKADAIPLEVLPIPEYVKVEDCEDNLNDMHQDDNGMFEREMPSLALDPLDIKYDRNEIDKITSDQQQKLEKLTNFVEVLKDRNLKLEQANKALRLENRRLKQDLRRKKQKIEELCSNSQKAKKKKVSKMTSSLGKCVNPDER